jgi:hypothetical protein
MPQPWSPYEPRPGEWTLKQAGHLLRRATFGFTPAQLQQTFADGPHKAVDRLLATPANYPQFEQSLAAITSREGTPLQTAQMTVYRLLHSPFPLHEKAAFYGTSPTALGHWLIGNEAAPPPPEQEALSTILRSGYFFSLSNYRQKTKTPLEFALNLSIALDIPVAPAQLYPQVTALGQNFTDPARPRRWLNDFTVIGRSNLAATLLAKAPRFPDPPTLLGTLLQNDAPAPVLAQLSTLDGRDLAQAIANLPEFQKL